MHKINIKGHCSSGKRRFETEKDALLAARDGMLFRNTPKLDVYLCMYCLGFHLTSSQREKKKKRKS
jgi:hypothetical protein